MARLAILCLVIAVVLAATTTAGASPTVRNCGTLTLGPTARQHGSTSGSLCFFRAFTQRCTPATYSLMSFGVDTVAADTFALVRRGSQCRITVSISFRVVPERPQVHRGRCTLLRREHNDVIALGCFGPEIPKTINLNPANTTPA